jgi:hypothetical protein
MMRTSSSDQQRSTLSPSVAQDLGGALAQRRSTWRETSVASLALVTALVGPGIVAAGWFKSRVVRQ